MFDRAMAAVVATAAAAAAVVMIVFALGFALYALVEPSVGAAAAAAIVALAAALLLSACAQPGGAHVGAITKRRGAGIPHRAGSLGSHSASIA